MKGRDLLLKSFYQSEQCQLDTKTKNLHFKWLSVAAIAIHLLFLIYLKVAKTLSVFDKQIINIYVVHTRAHKLEISLKGDSIYSMYFVHKLKIA